MNILSQKNLLFCLCFYLFSCVIPILPQLCFAQEDHAIQKNQQFSSSNLPIIVINTHGISIPNAVKITADMGIIFNGPGKRNNLVDAFNDFSGKIGIEIRGSSSTMFPKKQYGFETRDSVGNNLNVSLLGLPEENDWILYAPFSDKSLIRNILVYKFARDLGYYATRTKCCELVLNGEYRGVYVLMEKIKRDKNRVDISKLNPDEICDDDLTGGYIIKIDKTDGENVAGWYSNFPPFVGARQRIFYQYHYPKPDEIVQQQKQYIQNLIFNFEKNMYSNNFADTLTGYSHYIDIDSFVDYFILNEFSKNVDGYRLSAFMYKDKDSINSKLCMGPIWDYNLAFGNADYYDGAVIEGWQLEYFQKSYFHSVDGSQVPFWWHKLWQDANFKNKIFMRWQELRKGVLDTKRVLSAIDSLVTLLDESQKRNFEKWQILSSYIWPNAYIGGSYENEINYLKGWIVKRIQWMDNTCANLSDMSLQGNDDMPRNFYLLQNYPDPFSKETTIEYGVSEHAFVTITIFDVLGRKVCQVIHQQHSPGYNYRISWNGRDQEARPVSNGLYFYRMEITAARQSNFIVKKLVLIR